MRNIPLRPWPLLVFFVAACLLVAKPIAEKSEFKSNDGKFILRCNADKGQGKKLNKDGTQSFRFLDVSGVSKAQGIEFTADKLLCTLKSVNDAEGKKTTILSEGQLEGHVVLTSVPATGNKNTSTVFEGPLVTVKEEKASAGSVLNVASPQTITITSNASDPEKGTRKVVTRGDRGESELEPLNSKAKQRLHKADIVGHVVSDIDTVQVAKDETGTVRRTASKMHLTAAKAHMAVADGFYILTISGDVKITGTQTSDDILSGNLSVDKITIKLNEDMEIVEYEAGNDDGASKR